MQRGRAARELLPGLARAAISRAAHLMEHIVSQVIISPIWKVRLLAAANAPPALVLDPVAKTFVVHAHVPFVSTAGARYAYAAERFDAHFAACFQR